MNHYKPESNGATVTTEPLFGSVWLALYYGLRKNYTQRRAPKTAVNELQHPQNKK